ncbi:hypothetical protein Tco_0313774 [Tanacetum coccineum]
MHIMGKTLAELHVMLKLHEKGILKKAKTPVVLAIREGKIHKDKKKPQGAKGKAKGKNKLAYDPKTKIPSPLNRDNPINDSIYHHCKEVGHVQEECLSYHDELTREKNAIRGSARIPQAPNRHEYYVDVEEYELRDLDEPPNYKAALADPESDKWLEAMNIEMQSMKDN